MERLYKFILLGLFILGFVGAIAGVPNQGEQSSIISLIRDVRMAEEVNLINSGRWSIDQAQTQEVELDQIEKLFLKSEKKLAQNVKN
ncbi:MAG: hypothetical protein IPM57_07725 [Oligoflexia bacterium]|nr:hypothetical protein [Oligoflexia bacterium]